MRPNAHEPTQPCARSDHALRAMWRATSMSLYFTMQRYIHVSHDIHHYDDRPPLPFGNFKCTATPYYPKLNNRHLLHLGQQIPIATCTIVFASAQLAHAQQLGAKHRPFFFEITPRLFHLQCERSRSCPKADNIGIDSDMNTWTTS